LGVLHERRSHSFLSEEPSFPELEHSCPVGCGALRENKEGRILSSRLNELLPVPDSSQR
jgi:hypothetical protein